MRLRIITLSFVVCFAAGCAGVSSNGSDARDYLLSFPKQLKPGEQVIAFRFDLRNGSILAVNRVPSDWSVSMLTEAAGSTMSATPNHGASAFQDLTPLRRFVTVREDRQPFDVTGYIVVTMDFTEERTNYFTKANFILEPVAPNTH